MKYLLSNLQWLVYKIQKRDIKEVAKTKITGTNFDKNSNSLTMPNN